MDWEATWDATQARYGEAPAATWWTQATEGVNYYRADLPARHLPGKTVRFENRDIQLDQAGEPWFPRQEGGAAVWMFPGNQTRWLAMTEQHLQGVRVLVEVDDNYTVSPPIPVLSSWLPHRDRSGADRASYEVHGAIVRSAACDGVIVSTSALADVYRNLTEHVYVCPNSVDPEDWGYEPEHQPDGVLRVGWAGSASHGYDLADIRRALSWASQQKDVEVVVLGQLDPGVPHRRIPWTDSLAEYRRNVSEIDVMLCPLRPNAWSVCKSDVKALEAACGGACSVMADVPPFAPWKDAPGYFARTPKEFLKVVKHLIGNREEARETAKLAREYALTKRNIARSVEAWREALCIHR